jgi:hypothetical protein
VEPAFLGIDPGALGGFALLEGEQVRFRKMPAAEEGIWKLLSEDLSLRKPSGGSVQGIIEWISPAMFGTGKSSMSKLYGSYCALRMALRALRIPFLAVKPFVWQRGCGISPRKHGENRSRWKQRLRRHACGIYPNLKITLATSDALLIAHWGRLFFGETESIGDRP